ncbi:endonuclease domain-containing 1 protein-like [Mytilus edulis]
MSFQKILLLWIYLGATETNVSKYKNFNECSHRFFFQGLIPNYLHLSEDIVNICQQYNNKFFFATLYDTKNRIPVYSATQLDLRSDNKSRYGDMFFIEPSLVKNVNHQKGNMIEFVPNKHANYGEKQALDTDYKGSGYDRGHLNPQLFNTKDSDSRYATNTFTNIAPQYGLFNKGTWNNMEETLLKTVKQECKFLGAKIYVVVGVEPSTNRYIVKQIKNKPVNRVNVPRFYWTAICCDTSTAIASDHHEEGWSFAYLASNINASDVNVSFDPVDKFLKNQYLKIFADFKRKNGPDIIGCQFRKDNAIRIIQNIAKTAGPIFEPNPTARFEPEKKKIYKSG